MPVTFIDFKRFSERCLGNNGLILQMLKLFREHVPPMAELLRVQVTAGDFLEAARTAHRMKGSFGNICADGLTKLALAAENAAKAGDAAALLSASNQLNTDVASCSQEVEQMIAGPTA